MSDKCIKEMSYAEVTEELETIVHQLEAGNLELENSLKFYKRGRNLVKELKMRLAEAKKEVEKLSEVTASEEIIIDEEIS